MENGRAQQKRVWWSAGVTPLYMCAPSKDTLLATVSTKRGLQPDGDEEEEEDDHVSVNDDMQNPNKEKAQQDQPPEVSSNNTRTQQQLARKARYASTRTRAQTASQSKKGIKSKYQVHILSSKIQIDDR
jgi:hypothetical protein